MRKGVFEEWAGFLYRRMDGWHQGIVYLMFNQRDEAFGARTN